MATEVEYIMVIRRRVLDAVLDYTYSDAYYQDALSFALHKLNHDWGQSFTNVSEVTEDPYYFLLVKLATIEMCYVRAAETVASGSAPIKEVEVPNLTVIKGINEKSWLDTAKRLQKEYDDELNRGVVSTDGAPEQMSMVRTSLRTGGMKPYVLARHLTAPTIASSVDGSDVTISWSAVYDREFHSYEIWRGTDATLTDGTKVQTVSDNHDEEWTDEGLASDTYYYKMIIVSLSLLETTSNIVSAVVT